MADYDYMTAFRKGHISRNWETIRQVKKPVIAAVAGFALGGGCELAMMCDIVIAADTARFGQPEIKIGIVPGAGGTQRLPRAIGKAKAMDMVLTGRMMDAAEAERSGLVSRVVPADTMMAEALAIADQLCTLGMPSVMLAKDAVNRAFESGLTDGIAYERRVFHSLFGTEDQREGMKAFMEKRKAESQASLTKGIGMSLPTPGSPARPRGARRHRARRGAARIRRGRRRAAGGIHRPDAGVPGASTTRCARRAVCPPARRAS